MIIDEIMRTTYCPFTPPIDKYHPRKFDPCPWTWPRYPQDVTCPWPSQIPGCTIPAHLEQERTA